MTATTSRSRPVSAAPPATDREETAVLNGVVDKDLPLLVDVPPITLTAGERIVRSPDGDTVEWTVTALTADEDGYAVIGYRTRDGVDASVTVVDPDAWVRVQVGTVAQ